MALAVCTISNATSVLTASEKNKRPTTNVDQCCTEPGHLISGERGRFIGPTKISFVEFQNTLMEENATGVAQERSCSLPTKEYADAPPAHVLDMEPGAGGENILIP